MNPLPPYLQKLETYRITVFNANGYPATCTLQPFTFEARDLQEALERLSFVPKVLGGCGVLEKKHPGVKLVYGSKHRDTWEQVGFVKW